MKGTWKIALATVILAAIAVAGFLPRIARQKRLLADSSAQGASRPVVDVVAARRGPTLSRLTLPGSVEAIYETPIYARADGYIRKLYVDIGDRVRAGQLLAELDTPELDQQSRQAEASLTQAEAALAQAQASLEQARANLALADVTAKRWKTLVGKGVLPRQDGDEKQAQFDARKADVDAQRANVLVARGNIGVQEANVHRLKELKSFARVTAPFTGLVTVRDVTPGALVTAGSGAANRELLRIAQIDTLRIFVNAPQTDSLAIKAGDDAEVVVRELPNRVYRAQVARTANALDPASRTLRAEVQVANPVFAILPGMYAEVSFTIRRQESPLLIPGDTLVVRSEGTLAAAVSSDGVVHFRKIELGRDDGAEIEVLSGLSVGDLIVINPSDDVREGVRVQVRKRPAAPAKG